MFTKSSWKEINFVFILNAMWHHWLNQWYAKCTQYLWLPHFQGFPSACVILQWLVQLKMRERWKRSQVKKNNGEMMGFPWMFAWTGKYILTEWLFNWLEHCQSPVMCLFLYGTWHHFWWFWQTAGGTSFFFWLSSILWNSYTCRCVLHVLQYTIS